MRPTGGDGYRERRPAPYFAFGLDAPAMKLDHLVDQGETNPAAFERAAASARHAMETLEQPRELFGGHAVSRVLHYELHGTIGRPERNFDLAFERELQSIRDQIEDNLFPHLPVDVDRLGQRRAVDDQLEPSALDRGAKNAGKLGRESGDVGRLV